jgi:mannitol-1-/sugar-/sorbitol-6-phosphatase
MTFLCDAVLFDMDGTLVDSRIACENLVRAWAARRGLNPEVISASGQGRTNRDIVREFAPHLPANEEAAWLNEEEMRLECAGLPAPVVLISSDDVRFGKPHPEGYLMAAEQLGVAPAECLVIEDTPAGLEAAQRAGMDALAITTTFPAAELNATACIADFRCLQVSETEMLGKLRLELRVRTGDRT